MAEGDRERREAAAEVAAGARGSQRQAHQLVEHVRCPEPGVAERRLVQPCVRDPGAGLQRDLSWSRSGAATGMTCDRAWVIAQTITRAAQPRAEIHILAVEEEALVEAADLLERCAACRKNGSAQPLDLARLLVALGDD